MPDAETRAGGWSAPVRYVFAAGSIGVVLLLRMFLWPWLGSNFPFLLTLLGVLVSAAYAGRGPGLLALVLGAVMGEQIFFPPYGSLSIQSSEEMIGLLLYGVVGLGIAELSHRLGKNRRRAEASEAQFAAGEERYRQLVDNIADYVICSLDANGNVESWNAAAARITGWRADEIIGRHSSVFYPSDQKGDRAREALDTALREGHYTGEGWLIRKDGSQFWADVSITPIREPHGAVSGFSKVMRDLTDRKHAEESLRESESTVRALLESATQAIIAVDATGHITLANLASDKMFGYTREDLLGMSVERLLPERFRTGHAGLRHSFVEKPRARPMGAGRDLAALRSDGSEFPVEISLNTIYTISGMETVAFISDITDRKRGEEAVARHARLLDLSHEPIFTRDFDGVITFWNVGAELLYGWSREEAVGQRSHDLLQTVTPPQSADRDQRLREHGRWVGELLHTTRNGRTVVVESRQEMVRGSGGNPDVLETNRDVTERRRAEEGVRELATTLERRVEERTRELEEQHIFLQAVLDTIEVGVVSCDESGRLTLCNQTARSWLGLSECDSPAAVSVVNSRLYETNGRASMTAGNQPLARALNGDHVRDTEMMISPDGRGEARIVLVSGRPLLNQARERAGAVIAVHDITRQKQVEEQVRLSNERLQEANRELEAFSYSVSHDLRAPLRSIEGFSNILVRDHGAALPEKAHELLARIRANTVQMGHLIETLLNLSRLSRTDLRREYFNLGAVARGVVNDLQSRDPDRKAVVNITEPLFANADSRLIRIVLENLIGNAWKFTRKLPESRIEVSSRNDNGKVVYYVRDNGVGFDMTYYDQLFVPFQRLHRVTEFEGTGIGLATVARVIHLHGGTIRAESEPGKGATFYFILE